MIIQIFENLKPRNELFLTFIDNLSKFKPIELNLIYKNFKCFLYKINFAKKKNQPLELF